MIRGPVLPQQREALWPIVAAHLESIECGLKLVFEGMDCSNGQFGAIDGLCRDAVGAPVLVVVAQDGDSLLAARVLAAAEFLDRVGDALCQAVPEAAFAAGCSGRLLVVGADAAALVLERIRRIPVRGLQVCRLEPFRLAGRERFAVRWLAASAPPAQEVAPEFAVPEVCRPLWAQLNDMALRLDAMVRIDGDRFVRRIRCGSRCLGEVRVLGDRLVGIDAAGLELELASSCQVHAFGDRLLREFLRHSGLGSADQNARTSNAAGPRPSAAGRSAPLAEVGRLRSSLAAAHLSPAEYSALGGPASEAGGDSDGAVVADDVLRIVQAQDGTWPAERSR